MSQEQASGPQADALREALRQREQERSQKGAISRPQPAAGPPDLADVFGGLFGLLLGKSRKGKRVDGRSGEARAPRSARYDAPMQRSERYNAPQRSSDRYSAPQDGSDRYDKPAISWRDQLQRRLDEAKARLQHRQPGAPQPDVGATLSPVEPEPEPLRAGSMRSSALRPSPFVLDADAVSDAPSTVRPAASRRRRSRLRERLSDRGEVRELYVASVLLGPPLARRKPQQRYTPKT